jgi:RHS repeat-associated protein
MTTTDRTNGTVVALQTMGYDALDRVITSTVVTNTANVAGSALTTLTAYDQDGNVAQTQQPNGDVVYNEYDAADRLTNVEIDPGPTPLTKAQAATHPSYKAFSYDAAGNQVQYTDADNRTTTTQYDGASRVVQNVAVSVPPAGTTTITTTMGYDPDGNVVTQVRQTTDTATPGPAQTHTVTNAYNAADWETSTSDDGYTTAYGYDAAGQQRTETIVDGSTPVTMQLDPEGRVTSIGEGYGGAGPYTTRYAYNADDQPTSITLPNGVAEAAGYDANGALTSLVATGPNMGTITTTLSTPYGYGYNAAGWTTSTTTISGTDSLVHDGLGRLTDEVGPQVENPTHAYHWSYDGNGNLKTQTTDLGTTETYDYSVTQPNAVVHSNAPGYLNPDTYYSYDGNGDTTAITAPISGSLTAPGAINTHIGYDAQQRVTRVAHQDNKPFVTTVAYNADGDRARYTVVTSGTTTMDEQFQYRDGQIARVSAVTATVNTTGTVTSQGMPYTDSFVYGPAGEPLEFLRQQGGATSRYWYVLDGQGNVVAVTDATGKVVDRYNYDSWGEPIGKDYQTVPQQLRYAGYWYDSEVQWYWLSVRYYDPEEMRFLQPDPSNQDGVHTYAYVDDDPIDYSDPTGLHKYVIWAAAFIGPRSIRFPYGGRYGLHKDDASFHGDARGFWNGMGNPPTTGDHPIGRSRQSSRIWNYIEIDTNPQLSNPVVENLSGVGRSVVSWPGGGDNGFANDPNRANVNTQDAFGGRNIDIHINGSGGVPVVPASPSIIYNYEVVFNVQPNGHGTIDVGGEHTQFPWHELLIECIDCGGRRVISGTGALWRFSPKQGATPWNLYDPEMILPGERINI